MPRGSSPKREREYKELKSEFKKEGRYRGRQEEVAARIVNKQRAQAGETKGSKGRKKSSSKSSARKKSNSSGSKSSRSHSKSRKSRSSRSSTKSKRSSG